jgi:nucleotide-binding universal stress UspA family protein
MNKILVPVDFSENASVAARYAVTLSNTMGCSIHLLHCYLPFSSNFADETFNQEILDAETDKALENMRDFESQLIVEYPNVKITSSCENGVLNEVIQKMVEIEPYTLIVMGTRGASGLKYVTLGSNTFEIIKKSSIPVLAVPENESIPNLERVGMLTNFKPSEMEALESFISVFGKPQTLVLFHILEKGSKREESELDNWADKIKQTTGINEIKSLSEQMVGRLDVNEDYPFSVFYMTKSQDLGVLLVTKERKTFISKLFTRSLVKALAHKIESPIFFQTVQREA